MTEPTPPADKPSAPADPRATSREGAMSTLVGWTRFLVVAPILGLAMAAVVMTGVAVFDVFKITSAVFTEHVEVAKTVVGFIEVADVFLLSIVLYIMSLGLYELFIDDSLPLPAWLVIHTLDDLKEKLVGVVIVVLAVFFLGRVIESHEPLEVLYLGGGISLMIGALSYFVSRVLERKSE